MQNIRVLKKLSSKYGWPVVRLAVFLVAMLVLLAGVALLDLLPGTNRLFGLDMAWNVFLALLPLLFAMLLVRRVRQGHARLLSALLGGCWLVFYPNAPYMLTDLLHLDRYHFYAQGAFQQNLTAWLGLAHILLAAVSGCLAGCLSLYLVHRHVARHGAAKGWLTCAATCLLGGAGIYIGRFIRFNTWDLLARPLHVLGGLAASLSYRTPLLVLLFALYCFGSYFVFLLCFDRGDVLHRRGADAAPKA